MILKLIVFAIGIFVLFAVVNIFCGYHNYFNSYLKQETDKSTENIKEAIKNESSSA